MLEGWTLRTIIGLILLAIGLLARWVWQLKSNEMHGLSEDILELKTGLTGSIGGLKIELKASIDSMKTDLTDRIDRIEKRFNEAIIRQDDLARAQTATIHERLDAHINELHVKTNP